MTQVSWKKQLILAAILFVFGTTVYWLEFSRKPKKQEEEEAAKKLFQLKGVSVRSIVLKNQGKNYEFQCTQTSGNLCRPGDNSRWELVAPLKLKADDANVNSLLSSIYNLSVPERIDLNEETPEKKAALLKEYGVDGASRSGNFIRKVQLSTSSGNWAAYLGQAHPVGESFFTLKEDVQGKVDEASVFLVPSYFKSTFEHELTYWRDKKILTSAARDFIGFELKGSKAFLRADRKEGQWVLKNLKDINGEMPGDIENIDSLLSGITSLNAKEFASEKKIDAKAKSVLKGLKPILTFVLNKEIPQPLPSPSGAPVAKPNVQKTSETITLVFYQGRKPEKLYLTASNLDPLYELDSTSLARFDKEVKDLRLVKLMTSMERFTANRIEFSGTPIGTPNQILVNKNNTWVLENEKAEVDSEKIQKLLDKLTGNKIQDFLTGAKIPTGEEAAIIVALGEEKNFPKRKLAFWKKESKLYARDLLSSRKEVFLVDSTVQEGVPWDRNYFKKGETAAPKASPSPMHVK